MTCKILSSKVLGYGIFNIFGYKSGSSTYLIKTRESLNDRRIQTAKTTYRVSFSHFVYYLYYIPFKNNVTEIRFQKQLQKVLTSKFFNPNKRLLLAIVVDSIPIQCGYMSYIDGIHSFLSDIVVTGWSAVATSCSTIVLMRGLGFVII